MKNEPPLELGRPPMPPDRHIGHETRVISNLIHRKRNNCFIHDGDVISGTNGWILSYLISRDGEDIFQRDLEEQFQVRRATVSKIINLMVNKGLIERAPVPQDARLKKLVVTQKGKTLHECTLANVAAMEKMLINGIPQEKLDIFFEVCDMIKKNISDEEESKT